MIKLIAFDLDGTLINAYPAVEESVNHVMRYFGLPDQSGDAIRRSVGWGPERLLEAFLGPDKIDEALAVYDEYHCQALLTGSSLLTGAKEILTELKQQGLKLAVASNRPKKFSMIVTEHLNIASLFDQILCGDEVENPKPAPDMLLQLMKGFDVSSEEMLYVGDMTVDIETGRTANVKTIAIAGGSNSAEELEEQHPFKVIQHPFEVIECLKEVSFK